MAKSYVDGNRTAHDRTCEKCRFLADLDARPGKGGQIEVLCLSETSPKRGLYVPETGRCPAFERGPSIDIPTVKRRA
jgi:hypothetical protein